MRIKLLFYILLLFICLMPAICFSKEDVNDDVFKIVTDFTYKRGSHDSVEKYKALSLYGAKIKAIVLSAKYLSHKGLLENYGKKQKEIYCLAANEVRADILEEKYLKETDSYYLKVRTVILVSDFIKAEIKNLELEKQEKDFSWQEEMEQPVFKKVDPAQELSRAYRYIRKQQWRIAIIYLDHLKNKYPNWSEIYLAKAIGFYGLHGVGKMMDALKISCSLGNQEACDDIRSLLEAQ